MANNCSVETFKKGCVKASQAFVEHIRNGSAFFDLKVIIIGTVLMALGMFGIFETLMLLGIAKVHLLSIPLDTTSVPYFATLNFSEWSKTTHEVYNHGVSVFATIAGLATMGSFAFLACHNLCEMGNSGTNDQTAQAAD